MTVFSDQYVTSFSIETKQIIIIAWKYPGGPFDKVSPHLDTWRPVWQSIPSPWHLEACLTKSTLTLALRGLLDKVCPHLDTWRPVWQVYPHLDTWRPVWQSIPSPWHLEACLTKCALTLTLKGLFDKVYPHLDTQRPAWQSVPSPWHLEACLTKRALTLTLGGLSDKVCPHLDTQRPVWQSIPSPWHLEACLTKCTLPRHSPHLVARVLSPVTKRWGMLWCMRWGVGCTGTW